MKKYLLAAIMAVAVTGAFVSCSDDVVSGSLIEQKAKAFEETFIEAFGQPAPNHTWGFKRNNITKGSVDIITRGDSKGEVIKPDDPKFPGYSNERCNSSNYRSPEGYGDIVEPITDLEAAWVQAWFDDPANAGLSEEGEDFDNFFVQQVAHRCYDTDKPGYFWEIKDGEEVRTEKTYNVKMDQLRIGPSRDPSDDVTLHIYDFNAVDNGGNAWNLIYVQGGSSKQFGYHASYDNSWQWKFRCVQLTVPGTCFADGKSRTGWYVGLSYWTDKVEVAGVKGERIGENDVTQGNDWILKIVPGTTTPPSTADVRVIAEDLTVDERGDFDFNDVVFDVYYNYNNTGKTAIELQAAGGTYPLYVAGHEVHLAFGQATNVMINTGAGPQLDPVLIPLDQAYTDANDILVQVDKGNGLETLTAALGRAPHKIAVIPGFQIIPERQDIETYYKKFGDWVQDPQLRWY